MDFELKFTMRVVRDNKNAFQYYISENLKTIERKSFIDMDPDLFGQLRILCKKILLQVFKVRISNRIKKIKEEKNVHT